MSQRSLLALFGSALGIVAVLIASDSQAQRSHGRDGASSSCRIVDRFTSPRSVGVLADGAITEASGLAASRVHRGVFYTHNDSGDRARFFAIDLQGTRRGEFVVEHAHALDWEDIAVGPCGNDSPSCVYIGDVGDNGAHRNNARVIRVPEPALPTDPRTPVNVTGETLEVAYPDGAHDVEAMAVDPGTRAVYLFTKSFRHARVYRLDADAWRNVHAVATFVREIDVSGGIAPFATAADIHPCAARVLIRTYSGVLEFRAPPGGSIDDALGAAPVRFEAPMEFQSEAIAYHADGSGFVTVAEGAHATLFDTIARP